jgi:hypothetical protein
MFSCKIILCLIVLVISSLAGSAIIKDDCGSKLLDKSIWGEGRAYIKKQHSLSPTRRIVFEIIRYAYGSATGDSLVLNLFDYCDTSRCLRLGVLYPYARSAGLYADIDNSMGYDGFSYNAWSILEDTVFFRMQGSTLNKYPDSTEMFKIGIPWIIPVQGKPADAEQALVTNILSVSNSPNPFNLSTAIRFTLAEAKFASINVYNPNGELIRVLGQDKYTAGEHFLQWDGKDNKGQQVSNGLYFYQIIVGDDISVRKIILVK